MEWHKSFIVKDVLSLLSAIRVASNGWENKEYKNSFQPDKLRRLVDVMLDCPERPENFKFEVKAPHHEFKNICLTSGGADSTIAWYYANKPQGLYIDIGQPYAFKEVDSLIKLGIPYTYVDMRGTHLGEHTWQHIIPGRNFLFLCVAAEMLQDDGNIWFAMVEGEGADSEKGDKSLLFLMLFQDWYEACTGRTIHIQTMTDRTKPGWLEWFADNHDINIIRKNTVTCFSESGYQCGKCQACLRKYLSFISIGVDIAEDFPVHPIIGASKYIEKYQAKLNWCLLKQDFSHYSRKRCIEDLQAINKAIENRVLRDL